ncbi:tetratricopeptide repeat protein [Mesorhizobium sp. M0913]|uniref:caspase family protein n=1 Tax=Mesorhizobium sp. M0913 TaxID=2957026 RepID=UPI00333CE425
MWFGQANSFRWAIILAAFAITLAAAGQSIAQEPKPLKGVALIVGNGEYVYLHRLVNPANDARAVEKLFDALGFDTSVSANRDARRLKRDLDSFAEDADGADVAVLYYSGHGIEAAGENYLIPVDADLTALEAASERLMPLSAFIDKLKTTVPVVIVLLDACRSSPFPPGALIKTSSASQGVAVAASGLQVPKGLILIARKDDGESIGTLIGFAAEPGHSALDGAPGQNSPYAAAILKHLSALRGEEFGTVMRMITEEVYLKTSGRQRPWVNESLRRLLYFGKAAPVIQGDEGDILKERRQLLLTIAALPDFDRRLVETAAADGGVPMDALYGMLKTLGSERPKDSGELDHVIRAQTVRLKELLTERQTLRSTDPEIVRLSGLADQALSEGALATALRMHEHAKERVRELDPILENAQAALRARWIEAADVYARSAAAYEIAFNYRKAAEDYSVAFRKVERWDDHLALRYKTGQINALIFHGRYKGDNAALAQAISVARVALDRWPRATASDNWAITQHKLGIALSDLGSRERGTTRLKEAVKAFRAALEERTRERMPLDWAATQNNLGIALQSIGEREIGTARLEESITAYTAALEERTRDRVPLDWAATQNNLGIAHSMLGERETGTRHLEEAVSTYRAVLEEYTRDRVPLDWAMAQNNLGAALFALGARESSTARLEEAVTASRAALEERTRERVPLDWAATQDNLGSALSMLGEGETGTRHLEDAVTAYRAVLEERTRDRIPLEWAATQSSLCYALSKLGARESGKTHLEEAVTACRAALEERTRERVPLKWAATQDNLGIALQSIGERESGTTRLEEAVTAFRAALEERTHNRMPLQWARSQISIGELLIEIGSRTGTSSEVEEGRSAVAAAWEVYEASGLYEYKNAFASKLAEADRVLEAIKN